MHSILKLVLKRSVLHKRAPSMPFSHKSTKIQCRNCGTYNIVPSRGAASNSSCGRCGKSIGTSLSFTALQLIKKNKGSIAVLIIVLGAIFYQDVIDTPFALKQLGQSNELNPTQSQSETTLALKGVRPTSPIPSDNVQRNAANIASDVAARKISAKKIIPSYAAQATIYFRDQISDLEISFKVLSGHENSNSFSVVITFKPDDVDSLHRSSIRYLLKSGTDGSTPSEVDFLWSNATSEIKFLSENRKGSGYCSGELFRGNAADDKLRCPTRNHIDNILTNFDHPKNANMKIRVTKEQDKKLRGYIGYDNEPYKGTGVFKLDKDINLGNAIVVSVWSLRPIASCDELKNFSVEFVSIKNKGDTFQSSVLSKDQDFECKNKIKAESLNNKITFSIH